MKEKVFTLFWLVGDTEIVKGYDIADAFMKAGYGGGAMSALDFYENGDKRNVYSWNRENRHWDKKL